MNGAPVEPVDASTVILVRHGVPVGTPWQVFMVRRHVRSDFAADVYVFPGGKVDPEDADPALLERVDSEPRPLERGESREEWLVLHVTAIRELFEEAGVLLARGPEGGVIRLDGDGARRFSEYRRAIHAGDLSLLDMLREEDLRLAADLLHPFSRWITPVDLPRRFDTRFFVALAPHGQDAVHDTLETTDCVWISPGEALRRYGAGEFPLVFATENHLERMATHLSIEEMIAATAGADLHPVVPVKVLSGGATSYVLPDGVEYPVS